MSDSSDRQRVAATEQQTVTLTDPAGAVIGAFRLDAVEAMDQSQEGLLVVLHATTLRYEPLSPAHWAEIVQRWVTMAETESEPQDRPPLGLVERLEVCRACGRPSATSLPPGAGSDRLGVQVR